ncbi:oligoendopeptidase F [Thiohalorhabdus denitrificans]|uniref:Oligoendopeptidase F n=1 Tax=Thiohalorhabdus denitrificans TaxID=381306 RepID=A0A0P9CDY2_9GAMM|nr:M3 family oligoendopeptidase [Thiohalorhabdus denitrificans]KPV41024.1 oligoendopeptidase F [Thiohalorhabdus denitrificans]SCY41248.1 oligoendopeptidase F [Thiohalorhabdus denitrificans]
MTTDVQAVRWDLSDLYSGPEDPALQQDLDAADAAAGAFRERYHGRVADLEPAELAKAVTDLEALEQRLARPAVYIQLLHTVRTDDPEVGALLTHVQERATAIGNQVLFFQLEWQGVDADRAEALLADDALAGYRHFLETARQHRPYRLSEPEERILAEKQLTSRAAWNRLFDETFARLRFTVDGEGLPEEEVLARLKREDRATRRSAATGFTAGLQEQLPLLTHVFNTVLSDKAIEDRLRGYPHWLTERNLDNEASDAMVEALVGRVTDRYDLVARYYRLKARLLGLDTLYDYDRYAPLPGTQRTVSWDEARATVLDAFGGFSQRMREIAEMFFERGWIDAPVADGKQGGAFSHPATPDAHPYVMVNFTGTPSDVMTLAHELGHGVHQYLARERGYFNADTPLTTAETASVFGEMLAFEHLMGRESDERARLGLLCNKLEEMFATVFRQVAMNRFEHAAHTARREEGELSAERLGELWLETQRPMFGDSVVLTEDYRSWWSYIPHFLHVPGYVYAYAFGELLTLALYERYRDQGEDFVPRYLELLAAGGSDSPEALVGLLGLDLADPGFWDRGLDVLASMVERAERLADEVGPLTD